jgi:hypothetical protein
VKPIAFQPVEAGDILSLAPRVAEAVLTDCRLSYGAEASPYVYLLEAIHNATESLSARAEDGACLAIIGYVAEGTVAHPWMIPSRDLHQYARETMHFSKQFVEELSQHYTLWNFLDATNETAKRYLERLGFAFPYPPTVLGGHAVIYYEYKP